MFYLIGAAVAIAGLLVVELPWGTAAGAALFLAGGLVVNHRSVLSLWRGWKRNRLSWKSPGVWNIGTLLLVDVIFVVSRLGGERVRLSNPVPSILVLAAIMVLAVVARHLGEE